VLDALPYKAHSTAGDALAAGVPVLTCRGNSFAGRVAASLMQNAGFPEFVAATLEDYEARALNFANQPEKITATKAKLRASSGFDLGAFTRQMESAYERMWARAEQGLPPQSFTADTAQT